MVAEEHVGVLTRNGWLSRTPEDFQQAVLMACQPMTLEAGSSIYRFGEQVGGMFGVCAGSLEVRSPLGDAFVFHMGRPGDWMGAGAALTGAQRRVSISTRTDVVLARLPLVAIQRLTANQPGWWRHFGALAVENLDIAMGAAADLLIRDNERRCIAVLLRLAGARHRDPASESNLTITASQEELAYMARLSRNAAGGVIRRLAARKLIELNYRAMTIKAPDRLRAMIEADGEA